jgi:hypothetical protein
MACGGNCGCHVCRGQGQRVARPLFGGGAAAPFFGEVGGGEGEIGGGETPPEPLDLPYNASGAGGVCCPCRPKLNVSEGFKCRDTVRGYLVDHRAEERDETLPLPEPGLDSEWGSSVLDAKEADGIVSAGGKERFLYEAYSPVALAGGSPCNCKVEQTFTIEGANSSLLSDIERFLSVRHTRDQTVNPHRDPARIGGTYNDYTKQWSTCCERPDAIGPEGAYLSLVDAPGRFSKEAGGSIVFTILFRRSDYGTHGLCKCTDWILKLRLCIKAGVDVWKLSWRILKEYPRCLHPHRENELCDDPTLTGEQPGDGPRESPGRPPCSDSEHVVSATGAPGAILAAAPLFFQPPVEPFQPARVGARQIPFVGVQQPAAALFGFP